MVTLWDTAVASAMRGTSEEMSSRSLYKPPRGGRPAAQRSQKALVAGRSIPTPATCPEPRRDPFHVALPFPFPVPVSPLCTRGNAPPLNPPNPARYVEATAVRASLVSGAACMGPQHLAQSPLSPNLTVASRKRRGPLKFLAPSEPSCPTKW